MYSSNSINILDIIYEQFSTSLNGQTDLGLVLLLSAFPALLSLGCAVGLGLYYLKQRKSKVAIQSGNCFTLKLFYLKKLLHSGYFNM